MSNEKQAVVPKQTIDRVSAARKVSDSLRDLILRGDIGPGAELEEAPTAEAFSVSRNTVREAIRDLARAGLVEQRRLRPAIVVNLTAETVTDIFHVRALLELDAARIAATRQVVTPQIEEAITELALLDTTNEWFRLAQADFAFHKAIVDAAGSLRLSRAYESISDEVRLCLSLTDRWDTSPKDQMKQHRTLYDQIASGDVEGLVELLSAHIGDARTRVLSVLERADIEAAATE